MPRPCVLVVALLIVLVAPVQGGDPPELATAPAEVRDALAILAAARQHESARIDYEGAPSPIHAAFLIVRDLGAPSLLRALTRHASPVVRLYAVEALVERGEEVQDLVVDMAADTTTVAWQSGCIVSESPLGRRVLDQAWWTLDAPHRAHAVDVVVLGPWGRDRSALLLEAGRAGRHEATLRAYALEGEAGALRALAAFRREQDRRLVLEHFAAPERREEALRALAEWPLPELHEEVRAAVRERSHRYPQRRGSLEALAAYGQADELLDLAVEEDRDYRRYLVEPLVRVPNPAFDPLLLRLLRFGETSAAAIDRLEAADRDGLRAMLATIVDDDRAWPSLTDGGRRRLLELVEADQDLDLRARVIVRTLEVGDRDAVAFAAWLATRDRQESAIPALLDHVDRDNDPALVVTALRALFAYERGDIDAQVATIVASWPDASRLTWPDLQTLITERPRAFARPR